jgi:cytochrome c-type biogenesis protein CcmH
MTVFLALCILLIVIALAFVLPPLIARRGARAEAGSGAASNTAIYKEQLTELDSELRAGTIGQTQWSSSRSEIERRALDEAAESAPAADVRRSPVAATVIGIFVPVAAIALYAFLGNPQALSPESVSSAASQQAITPAQIDAMVAKLAEHLKSHPEDTEGWVMLARSYAVLNRFEDAVAAYAKAAEQRPADAQILADYADTLAMARGRKLAGEPEALIKRALKADGNNIKALALAGTIAYEKRDYRSAITHWQKILRQLPEGSADAEAVRGIIADAESQLHPVAGSNVPAQAAGRGTAGPVGALLQGKVSLAPSAAGKTQPEDSVFIFARAVQGPRMPLAVLRRKVKDLPFEFSLDDSMAMSPSLKLSSFDKVVVIARISRSGNPTPQKGDLEAVTGPLAPVAKGIRIEIVKVVE